MKTSLNISGTDWLKEPGYETGWFGIPSRKGGRTHVVRGRKPLCGEKLHKEAQFQKCATGIYLPYVECSKCVEIIVKRKTEEV